jgi:hypothetical protein
MHQSRLVSSIFAFVVATSASFCRSEDPHPASSRGDSNPADQSKPLNAIELLTGGRETVPLDWLDRLSVTWPLVIPVVNRSATIHAGQGPLSDHTEQLPENMVYIRFSPGFLQRLSRRNVSLAMPVNDNILGRPVGGTSQVSAHSEYEAAIGGAADLGRLRLWGEATYDTISYSRSVQVHTTGVAHFEAVKAVRFDGSGISLAPADATARSQSTVTDIETTLPGLRGWIASRIASRRSVSDHGLAEAETAEHVRQQVIRKFDDGANEQLATVWSAVKSGLAELPLANPLRPRGWYARSTREGLEIVALGPPGDGSGYVPGPTTNLGSADVIVDVHAAVIRTAMNDDNAKRLFRSVATIETLRLAGQEERPSMHWSDDFQWLSISLKPGKTEERTRIVSRPALVK